MVVLLLYVFRLVLFLEEVGRDFRVEEVGEFPPAFFASLHEGDFWFSFSTIRVIGKHVPDSLQARKSLIGPANEIPNPFSSK